MVNGQGVGRAGVASPKSRRGGRVSSPVRSGSGRRGTVDPDDLARLNSLLGSNLRFAVEQAGSLDPIDSGPEGGRGRRGAPVSCLAATGVLIYEPAAGPHLSAAFPVLCSGARRLLLHSLAGSLAECAMALGLGASVYRYGRGSAPTARR